MYTSNGQPNTTVSLYNTIPNSNHIESDFTLCAPGNILHASVFGSHVLILNKLEDAIELLENRSQKYSSRMDIPVVDMYVFCYRPQRAPTDQRSRIGWRGNVPFMRYDHIWRLHKKVCQQNLRQEAEYQYNPILLDKMRLFLRNLLKTPDEFEQHNKL